MKKFLFTLYLLTFCNNLLATPAEALKAYYTAMQKNDKALLREAVDAPDPYKDQFVKMIDLNQRMSTLTQLLNEKYDVPVEKRKEISNHLKVLIKEAETRKFKIDGDRAKSIPKNNYEVQVALVRVNKKWRLDLRKGQSEENLQLQAKLMGKTYDAQIALLDGLITNIDKLDTTKFSLDDAWKMIDIKLNEVSNKVIKDAQKKSK